MGYKNLADMFYSVCSKYPEKTGMMFKKGGSYQSLAFKEIESQVRKVAGGLAALGVKKGDKVVLLSHNRIEWAFCDYAILTRGAATVPIYPTLLAPHVKYIINNSDARVAILSDSEQFKKILEIESELKNIEKFVVFDAEGINHPKVLTFEQLKETGAKFLQENPDFIQNSVQSTSRDDLASIIYTSGTTGEPKGVMLTHGNFLSNIEGALDAIPITHEETFLSFLPLSHVFERMVGHFLALHQGDTIAYAESIDTVAENLQEVKPTLMASVPRLFEKIYGRILDSLEEGSPLKKNLFMWAINVGKQGIPYRQQNRPLPFGLKFKTGIADKLVYSKLRERVGGRIKFFVSGGAPLPKEIGEFFTAASLLILEGYGLTETSPVITVNRLEKFRFGTVGLPLSNVEVKIADDGEILTRGPHVMKGYYKKPEETKEAIDPEGWFHTGDIGYIDDDGFLVITDRKKNIIVTSGGKNVAPQPIENLLTQSRYIEQAVVIGDKRKFCSALIVPNLENLQKFAKEKAIGYGTAEELFNHEAVQSLIREEIDRLSKDLASYEKIKKFALVENPFTIESGELTPTLKAKRRVIEQRYKDLIDKMYEEAEVKV